MHHQPKVLEAITSRLEKLEQLAPCDQCIFGAGTATEVRAEIAVLHLQFEQLHAALLAARLDAANLRAAIYATLGAADDGEAEPLDYLRFEGIGTAARFTRYPANPGNSFGNVSGMGADGGRV